MVGLQTIFEMLPVVVGLLAIVLGLSVLANSRHPARLSFFYFATSMGLWAMLVSVYLLFKANDYAFIAVHGYYLAAAALSHGYVLFSILVADGKPIKTWSLKNGFITLPFLCVAIVSVLPGILFVVDTSYDGKVILNTLPYVFYVFYFVVYTLVAQIILIKGVLSKNKKDKNLQHQLILLAIATTIAFPFGMIFNLLLPLVGNYDLIMVGPLFVIPIVVIVAYSIMKYGLMNIKEAAIRSSAYILSIATMAALYFGIAYAASRAFLAGNFSDVSLSPINIILALLLVFSFQPVKLFFDRMTDQLFFRDRYDTDEFLSKLGAVLTSTTELNELTERAAKEIALTLKSKYVQFVVYRSEHKDVASGFGKVPQISDQDNNMIATIMKLDDDGLAMMDNLEQSNSLTAPQRKLLERLIKAGVAMILPLSSKVGYVMIGEHKAGGYAKRDIRALEAVSDELLIAVQYARSVKEVNELNRTLEQRISKATAEHRQSNQRLIELDESKDEFVSMASHQLRTPLTSIKGYLSMVLDGDAGPISEQQQKFLDEAYGSSERMVRLISDFLNVSRLQTGRFVIDAKATDFVELVTEEVEALDRLAQSHSINLMYKKPRSMPMLQIDGDKLRQVVMNFIDNAIFYSRSNSTIMVKLYQKNSQVIFEVFDQGIGVPKEVQKNLFTKFFRADNARRQRPDGTGIGLYLANKVITEHGGEVIFESTLGKGSVFGFRLPIKK